MKEIERIIRLNESEDTLFLPGQAACQGVAGAFSHKACLQAFEQPDIRFYPTFEEVFQAVSSGERRYGVIPIVGSGKTFKSGTLYSLFEYVSSFRRRDKAGSPPRSRGRQPYTSWMGHISGITPAFAGKADYCREDWPHRGDHPRVRGEGPDQVPTRDGFEGSPPRSRGRHQK